MLRRSLLRALIIVALIAVPGMLYWTWSSLPDEVSMPEGPIRGRHEMLMNDLRRELRSRFDIATRIRQTEGSLSNARDLQAGKLDFALYQAGTLGSEFDRRDVKPADGRLDLDEFRAGAAGPVSADEFAQLDADQDGALTPHEFQGARPRFVANLYSEVAHLIVRSDAGIRGIDDLRPEGPDKKAVAVGRPGSGDRAFSRIILDHFGLDETDIDARYLSYGEVVAAFDEGTLDAALMTAGVLAPGIVDLLHRETCELLSIDNAEALAKQHLLVSKYEIPVGMYRSGKLQNPQVKTVALTAQLLTREGVDANLVEEVTELVLSDEFIKRNELRELFALGSSERLEFARTRPEFTIHDGALAFYDPDPHPLLPTDFVEATEGIRSFLVSVLVALYLVIRWIREHRARRKEHRLDRYIRSLLDIERRQMGLDAAAGSGDDADELEALLDEVTELRQEALGEFSAHELYRDQAVHCFIQMCHELSQKVNAKITRQRFDRQIDALGTRLSAR